MTRTFALAAILGVAGCLAPDADTGAADEGTNIADQTEDHADALFQMTSVSSLALTIDPADIAKLDAEIAVIQAHWDLEHLVAPRTEVKATVTYAGATYAAKVKIKGMWSVQSFEKKPSLKIDFDDDFLGLKNLTLNAMTQDASMVHEALAYKMYEAVGVVVPRAGYANVTINGEAYGLYIALDAIDKHFLEKKLGDGKGILYEGAYGGDLRESDIGTIKMVHGSDKAHPEEEADHAKLKELIAAVNAPGDDVFFGEHALVDTNEFLSMMAMAYVIGDWDNYVTANNYRIYRHSQTGKWSFIPTGTDQTFVQSMHPYRGYLERNQAFSILFEKCMASERCIVAYDAALERAIAALQAPGGTLTGTLDRRAALIDSFVAADTRKPYDASQVTAARARAKQVIANRPAEIAAARKCVANGKQVHPGACAGELLVVAKTKTCLNVNASSRDDGAQVITWTCDATPNGRWVVTPQADGAFTLVADHSDKCATVEGTNVVQKTCANTAEQRFTKKAVAGGVQLVVASSGQCLDLAASGNSVAVAPCGDPASATGQVWAERVSRFD